MKAISKTQQAIDYLELISDPNTLDVIAVSKKVDCSERLVWEALRRVRKKSKEISEEFNLLKEIASDLMWISSYMEDEMTLKGKLMARDKRRLNLISDRVEKLKENIEIIDYIHIKEEKEVRKELQVIEKRKAEELQDYMKLRKEMKVND